MNTIIVKDKIEIPYISEKLTELIVKPLTLQNPQFVENERMNRSQYKTPEYLEFYEGHAWSGTLFAPRGFLSELLEICMREKIETKIVRKTDEKKPINFKFTGDLRPYQEEAIFEMLRYEEGTLCAATGSGKTVMGIKMIAERKQPTIIIVHTKELLNQWIDRISSFLDIDKKEIGTIGDGKVNPKPKITVALIQTLRKHPDIIHDYGYLIVDEAHRVAASLFSDVVQYFKGKYITGLSATPYRNDKLDKVIGWFCGPIRHKVNSSELIEEGHIVGIEPIVRSTNFRTRLGNPSEEYSKLLTEIAGDRDRNQMIVSDVIKEVRNGETCLVLSDRKTHCDTLLELFKDSGLNKTEMLTGDTKKVLREDIVKRVNAGKIQVLVATGQLIGEGFDCKNLSALFLTMPIRFSGRITQYLGRVLRPKEGKGNAKIYDYLDYNVRCLYGSYYSRQRVYKTLS